MKYIIDIPSEILDFVNHDFVVTIEPREKTEKNKYYKLRLDGECVVPSAEPEIIRCKDCKYRIVNEHYGEKGYMNLKAICELDTGDIFQLGRYAEEDDWFCADAERREGDADE